MKGKENKPHIAIFGRRNNGKSSLINCLSQQDIAIISDIAGTTTDPVKKTIEIFGIGPVVIIDTAGIDDEGMLGLKRVNKSYDIIKTIDLGIIVIANNIWGEYEDRLVKEFQKWDVDFIIVHNKSDIEKLKDDILIGVRQKYNKEIIDFSTIDLYNRDKLIEIIKNNIPESAYRFNTLVGDILNQGDIVLLITPIDAEAPEGRLILPQVQVIRDILDNECIAIVMKEREIDSFLKKTKIKPKLAITDSQVFPKAAAALPNDVWLTSFSIVLARYKGDFQRYLMGTPKISELKDGDKILILESCSHQISCDDIGRVKIPRWLSNFTGKKLEYIVVAGLDKIPGEITDYSLIVQCGGCVVTKKQLINRLKPAIEANVPITNYGMLISYVHGIYNRAVAPFTDNIDEDNYL